MSQDILQEMNFFVNSLLIGVVITFAYDWLLILRKCIRHNILVISIEDIFFWFGVALGVFYLLYRENNGILRWFAVIGATIGMWAYKRLVSTIFVEIVSTCVISTCRFLIKPIIFICRKIYHLLKWIFFYFYRKYLIFSRKSKNASKIVKKKLTIQVKLIKMMLCKRIDDVKKSMREQYGQKQKKSENI
jgi:spore cortex biosynthesis protein YabQ